MAANLLKAGHKLTVFDLAPAAVSALVAKGASAAASPAAAAASADVVVTMLPSSPHVSSVYNAGGVLAASKRGALLVDSSTIDPATSRSIAKAAAERGLRMLE